MVLASTGDRTTLEELAQLADKIVEVPTPPVAAVHVPQFTAEVNQRGCHVPVHPAHAPHLTQPSVGITSVSGMRPRNARPLAPGRETLRPVASSNMRYWPNTKSFILRYRPHYSHSFSCRHRRRSECNLSLPSRTCKSSRYFQPTSGQRHTVNDFRETLRHTQPWTTSHTPLGLYCR